MNQRPFIPRSAPKSFVVAVVGGLSALMFGGICFLGYHLGSRVVFELGRVLLFASGITAVAMIGLFLIKLWLGQYHNVPERPWREQIW